VNRVRDWNSESKNKGKMFLNFGVVSVDDRDARRLSWHPHQLSVGWCLLKNDLCCGCALFLVVISWAHKNSGISADVEEPGHESVWGRPSRWFRLPQLLLVSFLFFQIFLTHICLFHANKSFQFPAKNVKKQRRRNFKYTVFWWTNRFHKFYIRTLPFAVGS